MIPYSSVKLPEEALALHACGLRVRIGRLRYLVVGCEGGPRGRGQPLEQRQGLLIGQLPSEEHLDQLGDAEIL